MLNSFKVAFIGDIVGRAGRTAVKVLARELIKENGILFVVANAENSASGFGITKKVADELLSYNIDVLTLGNHTWDKKEAELFLDEEPRIIRPLNFSPLVPGRGFITLEKDGVSLGVINLIGRVFMDNYESPFFTVEKAIEELSTKTKNIIVDFHAEATSEKKALAYFLNGKVTAILGTHTHVQTADECILDKGTAFITDVGMTGSRNSIIGNRIEDVMDRFLKGIPRKLEVATDDIWASYVIIEIDKATGKALKIERFYKKIEC